MPGWKQPSIITAPSYVILIHRPGFVNSSIRSSLCAWPMLFANYPMKRGADMRATLVGVAVSREPDAVIRFRPHAVRSSSARRKPAHRPTQPPQEPFLVYPTPQQSRCGLPSSRSDAGKFLKLRLCIDVNRRQRMQNAALSSGKNSIITVRTSREEGNRWSG